MLKKARNDAIFDAILSKAFEEAAMDDIRDLEKADIPEVELTSKHKREQRQLLRRLERAKNRPAWLGTLGNIAACFLICIVIGIVTIFSIPSVRADFMKLIAKPFDKYTFFGTVTDSIFEDAEYTFGYIPDGFELVEYEKGVWTVFKYKKTFENTYFIIKCCVGTKIGLLKDDESATSEQLWINEEKAYMIYNDDGTKTIVWSDGKYIYNIRGNIDKEIMIKISENIKQK